MKKVCLVILACALFISGAVAQSILDSCYTSAPASTTFTSSATLSDAYDADLLEWTGTAWIGAWSNANINTPPPCNAPPVRALWVGDSSVWTTGGEAFGLKFSPPLVAGNTYVFFFTYVSDGLGSNGAFSPSVYTNTTGAQTGNYVGDFIPAGYAWETHPFIFTATAAQAGDDYLIIHSFNGSGMVLNLCSETITDLGNDSLTICIGDSAILFAGNGFQSYSWNTGDTTPQITVHNAGMYISTNQGFCGTSTDTVIVTIDPCGMFPIAVFSTPDNHICPGTCTDFTNLSQNAVTYQWTFTGATPATSTDTDPSTVCYNTPGSYSVQLIATNAITSDTLTLNNFITVYPYPPAQGILQSGDTLFANQGSVSYQWYFSGALIPGATDYFYVATQSGDYNVVCTDGNGCEVEAVIFDVISKVQSLVEQGNPIRVFPNPVTDELILSGDMLSAATEISVCNALGETIVMSKLLPDNSSVRKLNVESLARGIYIVEVMTGTKTFHLKFLKD